MLTEVRRVLKPGGHLFFKEQDVPENNSQLRQKLQDDLATDFGDARDKHWIIDSARQSLVRVGPRLSLIRDDLS